MSDPRADEAGRRAQWIADQMRPVAPDLQLLTFVTLVVNLAVDLAETEHDAYRIIGGVSANINEAVPAVWAAKKGRRQ